MPIEPTKSIWMNGELIPWDEAQIHVLTHTRVDGVDAHMC